MLLCQLTLILLGNDLQNLKSSITDLLASQKIEYGIAFEDLDTGDRLLINETDLMHAASTMKVPVMMTLLEKVQQNHLSLDQMIPVINEFKSIVDGSAYQLDQDEADPLFAHLGTSRPLQELLEMMITHSSNLATNLLIALAKPADVMALMTRIGCTSIQVRRGVYDMKAFELGLDNQCDALDMLRVMKACQSSNIFSPQSQKLMFEILSRQAYREMIPAGVTEGQAIVANKTGSISRVEHDSALVRLLNGRTYCVVIFSRLNGHPREQAIATGRAISKLIFENMNRPANQR